MVLTLGLGFSGHTFAADADSVFSSLSSYRVNSYQTNSHRVYLHRGDTVDVSLSGDGTTDLDLYVYDAYGNLCASRTGPYDDEAVSLDVYESEYFTIRVVNRGYDYNDYNLSVEVY